MRLRKSGNLYTEVNVMAFKDRLRELRGQRTQKEMAALLEVKASSYTNWENGREPTYETLIHIANYFDVSVDYLIDADNRQKPELADFCQEYGITERALHGVKVLKNKTYNGLNVLPALNFLLEVELDCYENNHSGYPKLSNLLEKVIRPDCTLDEWSAVVKGIQEKVGTSYPKLRDMLKDAAVGHRTERANELLQMLDTWNETYHNIGFEF